jgi:hypothetical protein
MDRKGRPMRVFAAALLAALPLGAAAEAQPRHVHECTRLTDPTALRDCILRFEGARPMPPQVIPPQADRPPAAPRAEPRRPPATARAEPRPAPTPPPLRGTIGEIPDVPTTGSIWPRQPTERAQPAERGRLP